MLKHTPGPWHWVQIDGDHWELVGKDDSKVADDGSAWGEYSSWFNGSSPNSDAMLMAAAPRMLAMLIKAKEEIKELSDSLNCYCAVEDQISALILDVSGDAL